MASSGMTVETPTTHHDEEIYHPNDGDKTNRSYIQQQNGLKQQEHDNAENSNANNDFMKYRDEDSGKAKPKIAQTNRSDANNNQNHLIKYESEPDYHQKSDFNNGQKNQSLTMEYGKTIRLLRNGDEFYRGHKFVINSRKYRYFDVFMDDISDVLKANFGAIRKIHTPRGGHRIRSLDEMEDGKTYVAAGNSRFIRLNYDDVVEGKRPAPNNRLPALVRTDYASIQVNQYDKTQNVYIYVYKNGDVLSAPIKILFYKTTMISFDAVLDEISSRVKLKHGAVFKLFTMEGEPVNGTSELINGNSYVAASKERFKRVEYSPNPELPSSPRIIRKSDENKPVITTVKKAWQPPQTSSVHSQPVSNYPSGFTSKTNSSFGKNHSSNYTRKDNSSVASSNLPPVRTQKNPVKLNLDKDDNGFYKAARHNNHDADTVEDNPNMYVDMPVDFKKAEHVVDENIGNQTKRKGFDISLNQKGLDVGYNNQTLFSTKEHKPPQNVSEKSKPEVKPEKGPQKEKDNVAINFNKLNANVDFDGDRARKESVASNFSKLNVHSDFDGDKARKDHAPSEHHSKLNFNVDFDDQNSHHDEMTARTITAKATHREHNEDVKKTDLKLIDTNREHTKPNEHVVDSNRKDSIKTEKSQKEPVISVETDKNIELHIKNFNHVDEHDDQHDEPITARTERKDSPNSQRHSVNKIDDEKKHSSLGISIGDHKSLELEFDENEFNTKEMNDEKKE